MRIRSHADRFGQIQISGRPSRRPNPGPAAVTDREPAIPWHIWCAVLAVTSTMVGTHWDIAWHRSIGRDTFWTPAHIAIYLGGVLAGLSCGYLILATSFGAAAAPAKQ